MQLHNLARAHAELGQHGDAVEVLALFADQPGAAPQSRLLHGIELARTGKRSEAMEVFRALVKDAPASAEATRAKQALEGLAAGAPAAP